MSGAVLGVLLGILSGWLVASVGLGQELWGRLRKWFVGADGMKAGWRRITAGARRREKKVRVQGVRFGGQHVVNADATLHDESCTV